MNEEEEECCWHVKKKKNLWAASGSGGGGTIASSFIEIEFCLLQRICSTNHWHFIMCVSKRRVPLLHPPILFLFLFLNVAPKKRNKLRNFHRSVNFVWCGIIAIKTNLKEKNRLWFFFCNFFYFWWCRTSSIRCDEFLRHFEYSFFFCFFIFFKMSLCNIGLFIAYNIIVWLSIKDIFTIFLEIKIKEFKYKHINRIRQKSNTTNNQPKFKYT